MTLKYDLIGKRFGKLLVLERVENNIHGDSMWLCRCDCGNERIINGGDLRWKRKSCGCFHYNELATGLANRNAVLGTYKRSAAKRKIEWLISNELAFQIMGQDCFYCGRKPIQIKKWDKLNGSFYYNGIDRVDNTKGYIEGNVVPCCKHCNMAKNNMTIWEFRQWVEDIHSHWVGDKFASAGLVPA